MELAFGLAEALRTRATAAATATSEAKKKDSDDEVLEDLQRFASQRLPPFEVPSLWALVPEIALSTNGKIDRRGLTALLDNGQIVVSGFKRRPASQIERPANDAERKVLELFAELTGTSAEKICVTDSFFVLGGNSLHVGILRARLQKLFRSSLSFEFTLKNTTVRELARAAALTTATIERSASEPLRVLGEISGCF